MKVPDQVRKTVAFVTYKNQQTGQLTPVGSVFFIGPDPPQGMDNSQRVYAVTARHVVDGLKMLGVEDTHLRLNLHKGGLTKTTVPLKNWFVHPRDASLDVAIVEHGIPAEADHLLVPYSMEITPERMQEHEVALGDEVFVSGLFHHHMGENRNIPVVRIGNLAALAEEKVNTSMGPMDAYLIEARSIGGISGSPVFLNLGINRIIGGEYKQVKGHDPVFFLFGLIHGHFESKLPDENGLVKESLNAGIAIVVPMASVHGVIAEYEKLYPVSGRQPA